MDWLALLSCFKSCRTASKISWNKKKIPFLELTLHLLLDLSLIALFKKKDLFDLTIELPVASGVECMQPGSLISFCHSLFNLESVYIINQKQRKSHAPTPCYLTKVDWSLDQPVLGEIFDWCDFRLWYCFESLYIVAASLWGPKIKEGFLPKRWKTIRFRQCDHIKNRGLLFN